MKKSRLPSEVDFLAQIADLKKVDYKNTLILTALIDLLVEKELISRHDVIHKAQVLDAELENSISEKLTLPQH
ncbi:hypothetical protein [Effusibacillus lacus]|uniref:Uncharacterized protein n=1 Tax=Effusibacillus lacus TaxID=1348429 RepID=A0A292YIX3_9BACL|nr:hypothetical protein [Effusibacillus lacus]TCS75146.1 hypothetical protein EDD64_10971 [Effusibacillus lacus]GAX89096.1 hypothetical protein EFBL_0710 [Effusibacillus lacus]